MQLDVGLKFKQNSRIHETERLDTIPLTLSYFAATPFPPHPLPVAKRMLVLFSWSIRDWRTSNFYCELGIPTWHTQSIGIYEMLVCGTDSGVPCTRQDIWSFCLNLFNCNIASSFIHFMLLAVGSFLSTYLDGTLIFCSQIGRGIEREHFVRHMCYK